MKTKNPSVAIVHILKEEALCTARAIGDFLASKEIKYKFFPSDKGDVSSSIVDYDLVITLGGDGTVLSSARFCATRGVAILPINFGKFGFIASVQKNAWQKPLENFINGTSQIAKRNLIQVFVKRNSGTKLATSESNLGTKLATSKNSIATSQSEVYESCVATKKDDFEEVFSSVGLNECVVSGSGIAKIVTLDLSLDGISFGQYKADGIIVATPTGSTAYSAAAGGPIIDPELESLVINPVCAFSLSSRPLVVPSSGIIEITILPKQRTGIVLSIDGQVFFDLKENDKILIQKYEFPVKLIGCNKAVFYEALRSKLAWSGSYCNGGFNA